LSSDDPDDRNDSVPTIEVTNLGNDRWSASTVFETTISTSHLRDADSIFSIAQGEFLEVERELKILLGDDDRAKDRDIRATAVSFRGDREREVVAQRSLLIELTRCTVSDSTADDVIGQIIEAAVGELRKALAADLAQYIER